MRGLASLKGNTLPMKNNARIFICKWLYIAPLCCCEEVTIFPSNFTLGCQRTVNVILAVEFNWTTAFLRFGVELKKLQRAEQAHFLTASSRAHALWPPQTWDCLQARTEVKSSFINSKKKKKLTGLISSHHHRRSFNRQFIMWLLGKFFLWNAACSVERARQHYLVPQVANHSAAIFQKRKYFLSLKASKWVDSK